MDAGYGREIVSLLVVFLLLGLTVWKLGRGGLPLAWFSGLTSGMTSGKISGQTLWSRRFAGKLRASEPALQSVQRLALTPQHTLHILRLRNREIVVATHPQGCTVLDQFEGAPHAATASGRAGA